MLLVERTGKAGLKYVLDRNLHLSDRFMKLTEPRTARSVREWIKERHKDIDENGQNDGNLFP